MEIKQAKAYLNFFRKGFLEKYNFEPYTDPRKPAVYYGCYPKQYNHVLAHRSQAVIIFCGSDAMELQKNPYFVSQLKRRQYFTFIAESNYISDDLNKVGLPHTVFPVTPFTFEDFNPVPLGKKIFFYAGHSAESQQFYGQHIIDRIKGKLPEFEFITLYSKPPDHVPREEMPAVYADCFIGLRLVPHDGMSVSVIEMGMMGRKVVWNGNSPNAIPWSSDQDIIDAILAESKQIGNVNYDLSNQVNDFINQPIPFLYTQKMNTMEVKKYGCSVIINTVQEDETNLRKAIASYKNQVNIDLELIISTIAGDPSIAIAKQTGCKVVIGKKGIYEQLNKAIRIITKPWYAYASGNDTALPTKLYDEISLCERTGKKVCYSSFYAINTTGGKTLRKFHPYDFKRHLEGNFVNDCAVISTDLLKKYAPFSLKWGNFSYWDFWLRIFKAEGDVFVYNPNPTWNYCITAQSSHVKRLKESAEYITAYNQLRSDMLESHAEIRMQPVEEKHEVTEDKPVIDIVFPYAIDGNKMDELKYAIRSIEQNFMDPFRIVIVGDKPAWLNEEKCLFIQHTHQTGVNSKIADSVAKMKLIIDHPEISEDFIYWYDDIYLLKPVYSGVFSTMVYKDILDKTFKGKTKHGKYLENTVAFMYKNFAEGEFLNGETHIPRMYGKAAMKLMFSQYDFENNHLLINTMYMNFLKDAHKIALRPDIKAGFYGFDGPGSMKALQNIADQVSKSIFLNHDDNGLNAYLKSFIKDSFPGRSACEL